MKEKQIHIRLTEFIYNKLEEEAKRQQITKSELIRNIVSSQINKDKN